MTNQPDTRPSAAAYEQSSVAIVRQQFGGTELETRRETQGIAAAETAKALVQARYLVAMQRPRDVDDFRARLLKHCKRARFAASAEYAKPVGTSTINGASIRFVEAALQEYGNVQVSSTPIYDDEEKRIVRVTVTDLERNITHDHDVTAEKFVERKKPKGGDEILSERRNKYGDTVYRIRATEDDYANKIGAAVSKAIRTLGLRVLPSDIVAESMDVCYETREKEDAKDPDAAKRKIADSFGTIGVMPAALREYIGHDLGTASPAEIDDLRSVFVAIRDGEATWSAAMDAKRGAGAVEQKPADKTGDKLKEKLAAAPAKDKSGVEAPKGPPPAVKWRPLTDGTGTGVVATVGEWKLHVDQSGAEEFSWTATDGQGEIKQGAASSLDGAKKFAAEAAK